MSFAPEYGRRDSYTRESRALIVRPDETVFIQNDLNTYRRAQVPAVLPPENRSGKLGDIARRTAKEGTMANTMGQALADAGSVISRYEVGRELSSSGLSWLITLQDTSGRQVVISRLRSHREGNGF